MENPAELFRALGDEERLRILNLLIAAESGACVCELVDSLRVPQYQVSRQLSVLLNTGLLTSEKRGKWVYYRVSPNLSTLARVTLEAQGAQNQSETATEDRERFGRRLRLRAGGACVLGYDPGRPFRDKIPASLADGKCC